MKFTAQEILMIALEVEKQGREFYLKYAAQTKSKSVERIFLALARAENIHEVKFKKLLAKLPKIPSLNFDGDDSLYFQAFGKDSIFLEDITTKAFLKDLKTDKAAIVFGLEREKATVVFYQDIKKYFNIFQIFTVNQIINEEKKHVLKLTSVLKQLRASQRLPSFK